MKEYLSEVEAADFLGLSPHSLQKYRLNGAGPEFHKFGRRVLYSLSDLQSWAAAQRNVRIHEEA